MIWPYLDSDAIPVSTTTQAQYVLTAILDKGPGISFQAGNWTQLRIHGTIKSCLVYTVGNVYACYCDVNKITCHDREVTRIAGATLVGNLRHDFHAKNSEYTGWYDRIASSKVSNMCYKYDPNNKRRDKISQTHHYHIMLRDIFGDQLYASVGDEAYLLSELDKFSDNEATHATFALYYRAASEWARSVFIGLIRHYGGIQTKWLKDEGMYAKQLQNVYSHDLTQLFELNVLVNRLETEVNWASEKQNRTRPRLAEVPTEKVYASCVQLFSDAKREGKRAYKYSYNEYWNQRVVLMPNGSVHSEKLADKNIARKLDYRLKTKKGFFAAMAGTHHDEWLQREPEIHSYTSTKYEWGKVRALYGCDVTSHLHADFGMTKCEETFPSYIPTGSKATEEYVGKAVGSLKHLIPFCYDYDDFNSQHSFASMEAVIAAWLHVYRHDLTGEQIMSVKWTANSIRRQFVHCSQTQDEYRTAGTLFSGWRLTTFMNTALNYAYLDACGLRQHTLYSLHNGDDVLASVSNIGAALSLVKTSEHYGIRAQVTKMNIGTIAEFLRMDMFTRTPTSKQYITRACATAVHSRIESGSPTSMQSVLDSILNRTQEVLARGGDAEFMHNIQNQQLNFALALFDAEGFDAEQYSAADIVCGGFSKDGEIKNYEYKQEEIEGYDVPDLAVLDPGIRDFVTYISSKLPMMRGVANTSTMVKTLLSTFNVRKTRLQKVEASRFDLMKKKSLAHVWRNTFKIGAFAKARMTSADLLTALTAVSPAHAQALMACDKPYEMLSLML